MKHNKVIATGASGIFKDKQIEIKIAKRARDSEVIVNGKHLDNVAGVWIKINPNQHPLTRIYLELIKKEE